MLMLSIVSFSTFSSTFVNCSSGADEYCLLVNNYISIELVFELSFPIRCKVFQTRTFDGAVLGILLAAALPFFATISNALAGFFITSVA